VELTFVLSHANKVRTSALEVKPLGLAGSSAATNNGVIILIAGNEKGEMAAVYIEARPRVGRRALTSLTT
jgi:hypothetical protein